MISASSTVFVPAPIERVYEFLADGTNNPSWIFRVKDTHLVSGHGIDAMYQQTRIDGPKGREVRDQFRIMNMVEPTRLEFEATIVGSRPRAHFVAQRVEGGTLLLINVPNYVVYDLLQVDGGTDVTCTMSVEPRGIVKLLSGWLRKQLSKYVREIANVPGAMNQVG
jgi:uncharacterized protein YndB with AHSA1/START domain